MGGFWWFIVGAGAATWWSKHNAMRHTPYDASGATHPVQQYYPPWGYHSDKEREEQRARFREMSRQAGDTMIEVSEATLDALLVAVHALREKLAERQATRMHQAPVVSQASPPNNQTAGSSAS